MSRNLLSILACWMLGGLLLAGVLSSTGCASIGAPTGGPRDSLPPVLVKSAPENYTTNFRSNRIVLSFDEFVDLKSVFEKLIINPPLDRFPQVDRKLSTVTIRIKDTLEPNTTYSWRFDDVIVDVNEGNPLGDFTYVLSTGPTFDSATFSGRVLSAETGLTDSTLIVILHRNLSDTAVEKLKPRYVTKLDGKGFFRFTYLAPGTYNVFALKDDGMKRYTDSTMPFAFHDDVITISDSTQPVELLFFAKEKPVEQKPSSEPDAKKPEKEEDVRKKSLQVKPAMSSGGMHDILTDLVFEFSSPLAIFDSTQLVLTDTLEKPVGAFSFQRDTSAGKAILKHAWKMETWYQIIFPKGSVADSTGATLAKNDTIRFRTKAEADYGSVKMEFSGLDFDQHPVLIILEGGKIYRSIPLTGNTFSEKLFKPGEYEIRILLDRNRNGVWDSGDYKTRRQPERNLAIKKKFSIRGNWENEFMIDINAPEDPEEPKAPKRR